MTPDELRRFKENQRRNTAEARHMFDCEDIVLHTAINRADLKVWYRCAECGFTFREDHQYADNMIQDALRITVPLVHPSKRRTA